MHCLEPPHIRAEEPRSPLVVSQSSSADSLRAEALDLELKHVCLLLGQLGHFLPDSLHEGCGRDVGQRSVWRLIFRQALL